ncbi:TetR family transcriptional regulator [Pyxidicoccus fallax]|uniref:TetR family transcriptional regulator n=1 Tax=Pyxidicoccus fallax TaxID=394095 RepID=A0A848LFH8_9BACT|nr:TetR family transcriptional regulator [Pyxidicoccus fallax]
MGRWDWENLGEVTLRESAAALAGRGYGHVRAEELARAGGMSVGSFYRRYGSKAGFAREVRQWAETELCRIARVDFELAPEQPERSFREVFDSFWEDLAWCATRKPELFHFTFMHWHPDSLEPEALGTQARELVREVLANGEREGALAPGSVQVGEGLIWGALAELVRAVARGDEQGALENIQPMGRVLWKALAAAEDSGAGGGRTPPPGGAGTEAEGAGTPPLEGAGTEGAETGDAGTPPLEGAGTEDAETGGAGTPPLGAAGSEGTEAEGAGTSPPEGAGGEGTETEGAGTSPSEGAGSKGTETEGAGTPPLEGAAMEGSAPDEQGASLPLEKRNATESSAPGESGASPPGAAMLEALGTEGSGAGSVETPPSGQRLGGDSTARDSRTALGATGVRRSAPHGASPEQTTLQAWCTSASNESGSHQPRVSGVPTERDRMNVRSNSRTFAASGLDDIGAARRALSTIRAQRCSGQRSTSGHSGWSASHSSYASSKSPARGSHSASANRNRASCDRSRARSQKATSGHSAGVGGAASSRSRTRLSSHARARWYQYSARARCSGPL